MIQLATLLRKLMVLMFTLTLLPYSLESHAAVILQYHHIDTDTPNSTSTSPDLFRQHIEYLVTNGYNISSLSNIIEALKAKETTPNKTVAITFDDGFISVYTHAFPILKEHKIPFTIFVNTDPIEAKRTTHVSWEQLKEMKSHGATVANHTHKHSHLINSATHPINTSDANNLYTDNDVANSEWKESFLDEVETAQRLLKSNLNQDIKLFAYPYGEFDQYTNQLLADMGYIGFGQHSGAIGANMNMQSLPRYPASNQYGKFPLIATKLNSIAFEDTQFKPENGVIDDTSENPPTLYIVGDQSTLSNINCFGSSVGALPKIKIDSTTLMIKPEQPFTTRRFRYNCTAKSPETGDFRWVSIPWVNLSKPTN